jgi:hypothetical protein
MKTTITSLISTFIVMRAIALPTDFSQSGDFVGFQITQSGDANSVIMSIHSEWGEGAHYDPFGHLFGPAGEFIFSGNIAAPHADLPSGQQGFLQGLSMHFTLKSESVGGQGLGIGGFGGPCLPGQSFAFDSAVSGIVDGQEWSAVLTFHALVAADGSGSGEASVTWTRNAVPDATSTLVLACISMAPLLGLRRRI